MNTYGDEQGQRAQEMLGRTTEGLILYRFAFWRGQAVAALSPDIPRIRSASLAFAQAPALNTICFALP